MPKKEKKTVFYGFKASPVEDDIIRTKMYLAGITNRSQYIRTMAMGGTVVRVEPTALHEIIRQIGYLSNNVNQIARRMNEGGSIFETEIEDIREKQNEILESVNQLLRRCNCLDG